MLCDVEVVTRSGKRYSSEVAYHKGHYKNPMTDSEVEAVPCSRARRALAGPDRSPAGSPVAPGGSERHRRDSAADGNLEENDVGQLDGKVALLTGAGGMKGIGRACALKLASQGADIVISDFKRGPRTYRRRRRWRS